MKRSEIPEFGMLSGLKVVCIGPSVAGPFAASMMADHGADVIFIENPAMPEVLRFMDDGIFNRERKNSRNLVLNCTVPEGQDVLFKLLAETDIMIEVSKGGQWEKWGLTDDVLWEVNPKLVIAHVSAFGQTGLPEYIKRPGYDAIGQAFGGTLNLNGEPDPAPPAISNPSTADYTTAMLTMASCLAAIYRVQKTGEGESLDIAQYEAMVKVNQSLDVYLKNGRETKRMGADNVVAGLRAFKCSDGWIYTSFSGAATVTKGLPLLGLDPEAPEYKGRAYVLQHEPGGRELNEALEKFCAERTAAEAEKELSDHNVSASQVLTFDDMVNHPHYIARNTLIEWDLEDGTKFKSVGAMPKTKNTPCQVWRYAPKFGMDNEDIFEELGYTPDEVQALYEKRITAQDPSLKKPAE